MVLSGFAQCSILYQYIPVAASCDYPRRTQPKCPQYYTDEWNRGCKNAIIKVTVWAAVFGLKVVGCCCWLLSLLSVRYTLFFHIVHCPQFSMHASEQAATSASFFYPTQTHPFFVYPLFACKISAVTVCVCVTLVFYSRWFVNHFNTVFKLFVYVCRTHQSQRELDKEKKRQWKKKNENHWLEYRWIKKHAYTIFKG